MFCFVLFCFILFCFVLFTHLLKKIYYVELFFKYCPQMAGVIRNFDESVNWNTIINIDNSSDEYSNMLQCSFCETKMKNSCEIFNDVGDRFTNT